MNDINPGELNPRLSFTDVPSAFSGVGSGTTGEPGPDVSVTVIPAMPKVTKPDNEAPNWSVETLD